VSLDRRSKLATLTAISKCGYKRLKRAVAVSIPIAKGSPDRQCCQSVITEGLERYRDHQRITPIRVAQGAGFCSLRLKQNVMAVMLTTFSFADVGGKILVERRREFWQEGWSDEFRSCLVSE
jgi:hypothetical protein